MGRIDTSWGGLLLKEEQKLSKSSRKMLGKGKESVCFDCEMVQHFLGLLQERGRMDDEGEIIYCKLLACYQLNRKEVSPLEEENFGDMLLFCF